jgi:uncharacterized protein YyaL (SSP411 family)
VVSDPAINIYPFTSNKFSMNRLQHETSPYLLQHASNPVDWYAYKPEAFRRAREEDKPMLISIGYSTCHWCHVMEHESFEDEAVAEYMNTHFVCIKVDREERPDVDQIYMEACQVMTGSGGWPLNVFCTPEGKPFYAGTYFPPRAGFNRPSWIQVLHSINRSYREKRTVVNEQAERLTAYVADSGANLVQKELVEEQGGGPQRADLEAIYQKLAAQFDREHGGFGGAPKFPQASNLEYLMKYAHFLEDAEAEEQLHLSLEKIIRGGMYDHLGGGFMRYATDQAWLVPHFEKMLYDNALLLRLLAMAWKASGKPLYLEVIEQTLEFLERELTGPSGGFYAALDADSEGREGAFYVWDWSELQVLLGEDLEKVAPYFGWKEAGNWEGTNIVWRPIEDEGEWTEKLREVKAKLFEQRAKRERPGLDDKYLLDWNALLLSGLVEVYQSTGLEKARQLAESGFQFLENHLVGEEPAALKHTYSDRSEEGATQSAFLDDYAFYIQALLARYEMGWDKTVLLEAIRYTDYLLEQFLDPVTDLFYFTSGKESDLPVRRHDIFDSSTPSGNSVMVRNLVRLAHLTGREAYREQAERMLLRTLESVKKYPGSLANWANALAEVVLPFREIAIIGPAADQYAKEIFEKVLLHRVVMAAGDADEQFPLLAGRAPDDKRTLIYLCENYTCQKPVETVEKFTELLST